MKMIQYNTIITHNKKQIIQTRNVIAFIMPQNMKKKLEKKLFRPKYIWPPYSPRHHLAH